MTSKKEDKDLTAASIASAKFVANDKVSKKLEIIMSLLCDQKIAEAREAIRELRNETQSEASEAYREWARLLGI
jgi:hypothetical protein